MHCPHCNVKMVERRHFVTGNGIDAAALMNFVGRDKVTIERGEFALFTCPKCRHRAVKSPSQLEQAA